MKAIKYEKDAVLIKSGNIKAWVDIWVENDDIICDWNQNDFIITDPKDVALMKWQDDFANLEEATCIALATLEEAGIVCQDENAKWHQTEIFNSTIGSIQIK